MQTGTCVCLQIECMQNFKNWCVHAVLHTILAYTCGPGAQAIHERCSYVMSLHLRSLPHYMCGVDIDTVTTGNEMQLFAAN